MNINLSAEELCSVFKIDIKSSDKDFMTSVDLIRKNYKVSQDSFCKMVGISRALYTKAKKGDKGISSDNKLKILRELSKIKELSSLEEDAARTSIAINTKKGLNKYSVCNYASSEKQVGWEGKTEYSKCEIAREVKEGLWKTIQAKQKLKRSSVLFQPSLDSSVDKITLFVRLTEFAESLFLKVMDRFGIVSGDTKYSSNARYKSGKVTEYKHIWQYEGSDCKVHVQYLFWDKKNGCDIKELKVEFNPNKWIVGKNEMLVALAPFLSKNPRIKEFDICKDFFGLKDSDVVIPIFDSVLNMKVFAEDGARTVYFGDKNKSVNLMIYDKRKEILAKDNKDIGFNVLRSESRYKLKCNELRGRGDNKKIVEYRVKLSDVNIMPLPLKIYSCSAHYLSDSDIMNDFLKESKIDISDLAVIKSLLSGGLSISELYDMNSDYACKIEEYLSLVPREHIYISSQDCYDALNKFVIKYRSMIDSYYDTEPVEGVESWRMKKKDTEFELVGVSIDWDNLDLTNEQIKAMKDQPNNMFSEILITRDEEF